MTDVISLQAMRQQQMNDGSLWPNTNGVSPVNNGSSHLFDFPSNNSGVGHFNNADAWSLGGHNLPTQQQIFGSLIPPQQQ